MADRLQRGKTTHEPWRAYAKRICNPVQPGPNTEQTLVIIPDTKGAGSATLNAIHPFREGNGRTQLAFASALSDHAGHPLDFDKLEPAEFLDAMIISFTGDEGPLAKCVFEMTNTS
ncbi:MAG: Fic family protein [Pseudomonadota bacterium]